MCQAQKRSPIMGGRIISSSGAKNLLSYKYRGADLSLLYKYLLSPLAELSLAFVPRWVAPNLITFVGLAATTVSYVIFYVLSPGLVAAETPGWAYFFAGAAIFFYQTLDNMDGKQVVPFFFGTWEQYYTGALILPIVNGPSEGVLLGVLSSLVRGACGPSFFNQDLGVLHGMTMGQAILGFSLAGVVLTVIKQITTVVQLRWSKRRSILLPLYDMVGFVAMCALGMAWGSGAGEAFAAAPYSAILLFGMLHTDTVVALMVAHVCAVRYQPLRPILLPLMLVWANSCVLPEPVLDEGLVLKMYTIFATIYEVVYLYRVVDVISRALGIYVFKLGKRNGKGEDNHRTKSN